MWTIPHFNSIFQLLNLLLVWSPSIFIPLLLLGSLASKFQGRWYFSFKFLIATTISFRLGIAALASFLQYAVWSGSAFTQLFLPPHTPWSYFAQYVFTHFWLNAVLSTLAAVLLWALFEILRQRNLGVVKREESLTALLAALLVGWPGFLVLIPTAFILAPLFTWVPGAQAKPTFEWPFLLAIPIVIFFAKPILIYLSLSAIFA